MTTSNRIPHLSASDKTEPPFGQGIAYSDLTEALLGSLARRKLIAPESRLIVQPHPTVPTALYTRRIHENAQTHITTDHRCNCTAGTFGRLCIHRKGIEELGGVTAIRQTIGEHLGNPHLAVCTYPTGDGQLPCMQLLDNTVTNESGLGEVDAGMCLLCQRHHLTQRKASDR